MKAVITSTLLLISLNAFADQQQNQQNQNYRIKTIDSTIKYDQSSKQLYKVKKQRVCREVNGKQECFDRGVATQVPIPQR